MLDKHRGGKAVPLRDQEPVGGDRESSVVMKAARAPAFIVPETEFLLELLVVALLRQAMVPVIAGASAGLAGGWLLTRTISAYLYEASEIDPGSVITATIFLLAAAAAVSWLPLMKATPIDPMVALRDE